MRRGLLAVTGFLIGIAIIVYNNGVAQVSPGPGAPSLLFLATPASDTVCNYAADPGFTCGNVIDAGPGLRPFATTVPVQLAPGKEVNLCAALQFTSTPTAPAIVWQLNWDGSLIGSIGGATQAGGIIAKTISQCWTVAYYSPTQLMVSLKAQGTPYNSANAQGPWINSAPQPVTVGGGGVAGTHNLVLYTAWPIAAGIGIPTYVSGGTPVGTGSCLLAASGGGGTNGQLTMNVSGGAFQSFAIANTGYAFTSEPTLWNYVSGTACSTAVTTSGGTLGGAQGNAYTLQVMDVHS